jgi:NADPH:quinone reductase-like Zn-dependent oxidoreductase
MRAVAVTEFGGTPQLMDLPKPSPAAGEVLVRLVAASFNPFDRAVFDGFLRDLPHSFPLVIGFDGAGMVEEIGEQVDRFRPGDAVYGSFAHVPLGRGTLAEYIAIPENTLIDHVPDGISLKEAAAAPGAGMAAVGLLEETRIEARETVLIVGASGGVGGFAVQLASARGARVFATARPDDAHRLRSLGAVETVDYSTGSLVERVQGLAPDGIDVLLDLVSDPPGFLANVALVRDGGRAASLTYAAQADLLEGERIDALNFSLRLHPRAHDILEALGRALSGRPLDVQIEAELSLEQAAAAVGARGTRGARGKTVVSISPEDL